MKKLLLKSMLLLCALVVGSNTWAAENTVTWTASSGALGSAINAVNGTATGTIKTGTFDWDFTRTLLFIVSNKSDYIAFSNGYMQCGSNNAKESLSFTTSNIPGVIKSISVDCYSKDGKHNLSIAVDGTSYFNGATASSNSDNTKTGTGTSSGDIEISFSLSNPSTQGGAIYIKSITVIYESNVPTHTITYSATNGSIAGVDAGSDAVASGASVAEGAIVTLTATPSAGYKFSSWSVSGTDSSLSSTSTNPTTFTMGTANATVTANFEVDNTVATPTFDPDGSATYTQAQNVTISCATGGATIYYTTDNSDPDDNSNLYSGPVAITTSGTVLKAIAYKGGMTHSDVASATFTIRPNKPTVSAVGPTVTITGDNGSELYYTTDGTTPTNASTKYTAPFDLNADCTIKARAYDNNDNASMVTSFTYKYMPLAPKNINSNHFVKVTNVSELENGDAILIVNETASKALGPQSGNNCPAKAVTITSNTINSIGDAQKLVLVKMNVEISEVPTDVFYFYTGSGYLYASSTTNNYLKQEDMPDNNNNARATINISSGDATINFTGNSTRNWLKYNSTSSLFSCYVSNDGSMQIVQIYKEIPTEPADPTDDGVGHVTIDVSSNMDGWRTFYPSKADQAYTTDADVYYASATGESTVTLTKIDGGVPANTPVVLHKDGATSIVLTETGTDITAPGASNKLAVSTAGQNLGKVFRLGFKSGAGKGVGFYSYTTTSAPAGIIYVSSITAGARDFLGFDFGDEATGVNEVKTQKVDGEYYNLAGQRVTQPTKGLYIVNGKKVIVK